MSIKIKLILSYIAMLLIPIVLSGIAAVVIAYAYVGDIKEGYQFDFKSVSMENLIEEEAETFEEIIQTVQDNPDKLLDVEYLEELDKKVSIINTGIIVSKNDEFVYVSELLDNPEILNMLSDIGEIDENYHGPGHGRNPTLIGNSLYSTQRFDLHFSDNSSGTLFMVADVSPIGSFARKFMGTMIVSVILILLFTNGFLTFLVSRSIIKPINVLKNAALQIKEGNLDFEVTASSNDEIGQLSHAFEEMRCKLKESIDAQMQYEDNRKVLISNISHDLKTPITAIKGYTEGLMDGVADTPEKTEKYIQTIHDKAIDVDKLIEELFLYSKLDLKREPFNFEKVEIKSYLKHIMEQLIFDLNKTDMQLNFDTGDDTQLIVVADREKLKRVINNIIDNSIKYMDKQTGKIGIKMHDAMNTVTIEISDNGQGISAEALPLIFERFYRADPSRNAAIHGSGLGLAIAGRIIEEHGGMMWAESEEKIGTSIFFTLQKGS